MQKIANFLPTNRPQFKPRDTRDENPFVQDEPQAVVLYPTEAAWRDFVSKYPHMPQGYCKYGCGGSGYFRRDLPVGHPSFGKAISCACTKEKAARVEQSRESLSTIEQAFTIENWIGNDPTALAHAKQAIAQAWGMFCFWGDVGVGKSGLLIGIVNVFLDRKQPAVYKTAAGLLDELRDAYKDETYESLMKYFCGVKVLALDEVWRHKPTEWAEEKLFYLLDYRYRFADRLLTVIATNAEPDYQNALWSRFSDRQRSTLIHVKGRDVRPMA
jgi:DNA replication protein DnaC